MQNKGVSSLVASASGLCFIALRPRGLLARVLAVLAVCVVGARATSVRLRGGATQWDGRVEVLHEKDWGTVCDVGWDLTDANVTCRQLGFSLAVGVTTGSSYGSVGDNVMVWLEGVDCEGGESDIGECVSVGGWGVVSSECENHAHDAGVICADSPNALSVRLVGGATVREGRVEVLFGDEWGGVCDDGWGLEESTVVCRQLGFDYAEDQQPTEGEFGEGVMVIWLDDVMCDGEEGRLVDCQHSGWAEHNCLPSENIAVRCAVSDTNNCSVRLSATMTGLDYPWVGVVELFANDEWGRVCNDSWGPSNADVLCRQLGYYGALDALSLTSDPPSELYWLAGVGCVGSEGVLCECPSNGVANSNCRTMGDAGVVCKNVSGDPYDIRLVGGAYAWEGRVEVSVNGEWGTVCSPTINITDANVMCRQLGYPRALISYFAATFGQGMGVQWLDNVECSGTEDNIFDCPHGGLGQVNPSCSNVLDLSVICQADAASDNETAAIRLVGGTSQYEGRVEVLYNGRWGLVCDDGWSLTSAAVVCAQLGFGNATSDVVTLITTPLTSAPTPIWLDDVLCNGTETVLSACPHSAWAQHDCSPNEASGVVCSEPGNDTVEVRLVGGPVENSGRVEIYYGGVWGTVCNIGWDIDDATVVCRQLGYPGAMSLLGDGAFSEGAGVVWVEGVSCHGNQSRLAECGLSGWGDSECNHSRDAGVICEEVPTPTPSVAITSSPLTSPLVTSPLLPLPNEQSSLSEEQSLSQATPTTTNTMATTETPPTTILGPGLSVTMATEATPTTKVGPSISVTMATDNITTPKATPTDGISTSDSVRAPVVAIGAGTLAVAVLLALAAIALTTVCSIVRLRRRKRRMAYDMVSYKNGTVRGVGSRDRNSVIIPFSSMPQHTVLPDDGESEANPNTTATPRPPQNFISSHPDMSMHFTNPHTEEEEEVPSTFAASPDHEATPTGSTSHDTELPTTTASAFKELKSLEEDLLNISHTSDKPLLQNMNTLV